MSDNLIFALDIGTRSVVGVVLQETSGGLEIIAAEHLEHRPRAMVDGQIHDIEQVAGVIKKVKASLEGKVGRTLDHAAVAAAGRALKTIRLKVNSENDFREIHRDDIIRLELEAVQEAQHRLGESSDSADDDLSGYHCVGYSVVNYELDGHKIGNLVGQKGRLMAVDIIATFLPRVVVDSLLAALHRSGLEMTSLTLEPIAASVVVVPQSMRQLNIALVDIGAGTSDIAVTDEGSIIGYGMVPVAGDEVTEIISRHCLVDFNEAENIKRSVQNCDPINFVDVLGVEGSLSKQEVHEVIYETVQDMAQKISEKILEVNGRTPQAVICIGGGSQTPLLKDMLAEKLGLSKQRVAIRGREAIKEVSGGIELEGPEAVTPIGIAVSSYEHQGLGFARVTVNNKQVRLFEVNRGTVADALVAAGISIRSTRPRLGMALTVTVNGELKIIKGGRGQAAVITLNGSEVTIDTPVKHNDVIEFTEAVNGQDATGSVFDVVPQILPMQVVINKRPVTINPVITMNDQPAAYNDKLEDNARIVYHLPRTLAEVLEMSGYGLKGEAYYLYVNDRVVDPLTEINDGDEIVLEKIVDYQLENAQDFWTWKHEEPDTEITNEVENEVENDVENELETDQQEVAVSVADNGIGIVVNVNQERVEIPRNDVILTDILTRINFPLTPPVSRTRLEIKVNGMLAEFTTPLKYGDNITLEWK